MKKFTLLILMLPMLVLGLAACGNDADIDTDEAYEYDADIVLDTDEAYEYVPDDIRVQNLYRLAKVWGFVKYTHNSFILGQLDWDAELLNLLPLVYDAEDVNAVLYDWFVGLGNDMYDQWAALISARDGTVHQITWRPMTDLSWINYEELGPLAAHLLRFNGTIPMERASAPVFFHIAGAPPDFSNQSLHEHMDFSDTGYRLLGLFRLWNAMKYYFPHLDVLDVEWNDLLFEFIPKMLEGTDRLSYELTLAAMAHHLHDAHVVFFGATFFADKFGRYLAPAQLIAAEGRLVIYEAPGNDNPLTRGDIILGVNGRDIDEITAEMRSFSSYPNEEKALAYLAGRQFGGIPAGMDIPEFIPLVLRSHVSNIEIDVLRDSTEITFSVNGATTWPGFSPPATQSHALLDNNIGLINPSISGDVRSMMESFADTDGIIIDLRQRPIGNFMLEMRQYLMEEPLPFAYLSRPSQTHPGSRMDFPPMNQYLPQSPYAFVYDRPVVLLMSEQTFSHPEWVIMAFRTAPNVTVMGPYSMGSNGNVAVLPLPGGIIMNFTSLGVYTPEGGQTHRIGLAPDIRVDRTIQGITEGRDELIEAAVLYIVERQ